MKTSTLSTLLLALILSFPFKSQSQTCIDPIIILEDDIESYTEGDVTDQSPNWDIWPGASIGGIVSTEQAASGNQSIKLQGGAEQDVLFFLGDSTSGHYRLSWEMYIPDGNIGYFNIQHAQAASNWGIEALFLPGVGGIIIENFNTVSDFDYPNDVWFDVILLFDIDRDYGRLIIDEYTVWEWQFSNNTNNINQLGAINFWAPTEDIFPIIPIENRVHYVDNIRYEKIPAAETGKYCYTGLPIEPGIHTVPDLDCFGGGYDLGGSDGAWSGYWYVYTPSEDGRISITTCNGGVDTRGWILTGTDCYGLQIVGVNDDQCDLGDGNEWATIREAVVTAGNTYYLLWDNAWEPFSFDFELSFTTDPGAPGDFCETAIPIEPGEHEIQEITGNAVVTGPDINTFTTSVTPYAQSKWYVFTPSTNGGMTISSCDFAGSDTRVWVYAGACGTFETLDLLATNDDGCGDLGQTLLDSVRLEGGTSYYIEWDDRLSDDPFIWELQFEEAIQVEVTFNVVMTEEPFVAAAGVHIAGEFNDWTADATPMIDNGNGSWSVTLTLSSYDDYAYKFINGNAWGLDELNITAECGILGGSGSFDRIVDIPDNSLTSINTPFYCFNTCTACPDLVDVEESAFSVGFEVFPNPANDQLILNFDFEQKLEGVSIELFNTVGQQIMKRKMESLGTQTVTLDVSLIPEGTYFLSLNSAENNLSKKISIRR